jgi:hypothetical protein
MRSRKSACAYSRTKFIFTDKIGLKMAIFCQMNYFKSILYVKFLKLFKNYFGVTGFLCTKINAVYIKICWFFAKFPKINNPVASEIIHNRFKI